ncbi:MAG: hypothetical protein JNL90_18540 [Planctomycetes bacterium]|nr:hypothetical protein [Planctomycetota bacterium]
MSRGGRAGALLAALCFATTGEPPPAPERLLLERKLEVQQVFTRTPLTEALLDRLAEEEATIARCRAAGDAEQELAALTRAAQSLDGREEQPWRALRGALVARPERHLVDAAGRLSVRFEWLFPPDPLPTEPCTLRLELASAAPLALGAPPQRIALLAERAHERLSATTPPAPLEGEIDLARTGSFVLLASVVTADGVRHPLDHTAPLAVTDGLAARVAALEARRRALVDARRDATSSPATAGSAPALARALEVAALPADLLVRITEGARTLAESLLEVELARASELLDAVERGAPPPLNRGFERCVVRLPSTGELVPWLLFVPERDDATSDAAPAAPAPAPPLLVALHGLGVREESWLRYGGGALEREARARGCVVALPSGWRADSFYVGPGEEAVLAVIDAACARVAIDPDRIALIGHSMGGFGALRIAGRNAARFAAVASIAGAGRPSWLDGFAELPTLLVHGDADEVVPVALSRNLARIAKVRGLPWRYWELAGARHVEVVAQALPEVLDFCLAARRAAR